MFPDSRVIGYKLSSALYALANLFHTPIRSLGTLPCNVLPTTLLTSTWLSNPPCQRFSESFFSASLGGQPRNPESPGIWEAEGMKPSTLARAHPDHPKLQDLGSKDGV